MLIGHLVPEVTCACHLGTISVSHIKFALAPPSFAGSNCWLVPFGLACSALRSFISLHIKILDLPKMPPSKWGTLSSLYYRLL